MSVRGVKLQLVLLAVSFAVWFSLMELAIRYLPAGDKMGWSMVPSVPERVAKAGGAMPGKARILALGDSMTEWRDNTGESYMRVAERMLSVDVVNLAEGGTGLREYLSNLLRFGEQLQPDVILIGLYLGNDLVPSTPPLNIAEMRAALRASPSPPEELTLKRIAKRSVLLNYFFRLGKLYVPILRPGTFEKMISQLKERTGMDDTFVARRLSEADPTLVDAARADAINGWDLALAIFDRDHYGDLAAAAASDTPKGKEVERALSDLETIIAASREYHAKIAIVLLPPPVWVGDRYWSYFKRLGNGELGPASGPVPLVERLKAYLSAEGVPALDVLPALRADAESTFLENDVHLNRRGHEIIGRELASFLVKEALVPGADHRSGVLGTAGKITEHYRHKRPAAATATTLGQVNAR